MHCGVEFYGQCEIFPLSSVEVSKKISEAEQLACIILRAEPKNLDALKGLGLIKLRQRLFGEAINLFKEAFELSPNDEEIKIKLVSALESQAKQKAFTSQLPKSIELIKYALELYPLNPTLLCRMSLLLSISKNFTLALEFANKAFSLEKKSSEAHSMVGLALLGLQRLPEAEDKLLKSISINPDAASAHSNLSLLYRAQGEYDKALETIKKAALLDDQNPQILNNLGVLYLDCNYLEEAEKSLRRCLDNEPEYSEAHYNLGRVLLMAEKFTDGWEHSEWRWSCAEFPFGLRNTGITEWEGQSLKGKTILVWGEQGIGDEIMFASMIPELNSICGKLLIECDSRLKPIFKRSFDNITIIKRNDLSSELIKHWDPDYQISMGSLCKFLRKNTPDFQKNKVRYLKENPELKSQIHSRYSKLGPGLKIGISWLSGNQIIGPERSVPLKLWGKILSFKKCHFINLQYGDVSDEINWVSSRLGVKIYQDKTIDPKKNAEGWFAQIASLDQVISIDNSTIQVSGSLGVPTWILLSRKPEWRFGLNRSDHLWHSSARVYRQKELNNWGPVINEVANDLSHSLK